MYLTIFSLMAALDPGRLGHPAAWSGEVDLDPKDPHVNDHIFRLFNRVDDEDNDNLEAIGYRLPSLSVGDYFCYEGRCFQVVGVGFHEITPEDLIRALAGPGS